MRDRCCSVCLRSLKESGISGGIHLLCDKLVCGVSRLRILIPSGRFCEHGACCVHPEIVHRGLIGQISRIPSREPSGIPGGKSRTLVPAVIDHPVNRRNGCVQKCIRVPGLVIHQHGHSRRTITLRSGSNLPGILDPHLLLFIPVPRQIRRLSGHICIAEPVIEFRIVIHTLRKRIKDGGGCIIFLR